MNEIEQLFGPIDDGWNLSVDDALPPLQGSIDLTPEDDYFNTMMKDYERRSNNDDSKRMTVPEVLERDRKIREAKNHIKAVMDIIDNL